MAFGRLVMITCFGLIASSGGILGAGPASAAASPSNLNIDCYGGDDNDFDQTFTGAVGDTFTLTNTDFRYACLVVSFAGVVTASGVSPVTGGYEIQHGTPATLTVVASGQFIVKYNSGRAKASTITVVALPAPAPAPASARGSTPAPVIQQFGLPDGQTCEEAAPEKLNWSGVAPGGWGQSWAQWMNDGLGGDVCTRMLVMDTATSQWTLAD